MNLRVRAGSTCRYYYYYYTCMHIEKPNGRRRKTKKKKKRTKNITVPVHAASTKFKYSERPGVDVADPMNGRPAGLPSSALPPSRPPGCSSYHTRVCSPRRANRYNTFRPLSIGFIKFKVHVIILIYIFSLNAQRSGCVSMKTLRHKRKMFNDFYSEKILRKCRYNYVM